ncbi:MAG: CDP-alcohol phosphatidyltransferase family protein [Patescibacteria group bacterium]
MIPRDPAKLFPHDYVMKYTFIPLIPRFVTPNMITIFRLLGTPIMIWFLLIENYTVAIPLFIFLALTDAIDGSLARLRHQITDWGTFYDPLADKILIGSVVLIVVAKHVNIVLALVILFMELVLILGGYIRKRKGKVTSANIFGKTKMFLQVLGVIFLLIAIWAGYDLFIPISAGTLALAVVFAVISLFTYGL